MTTNTTQPAHPVFQKIADKYHNTKPIRGRDGDQRPWGNRRRQAELVRKIDDNTYAARLHYTDVLTVHRDGSYSVDMTYNSQLTNKFLSLVLRELHLPGIPVLSCGKPWLLFNGDYHPAWDAPVPIKFTLHGFGGYSVDMTHRRYSRMVADLQARRDILAGVRKLRSALRSVTNLTDNKLRGDTLLEFFNASSAVVDRKPVDTLEWAGATQLTVQECITTAVHLIHYWIGSAWKFGGPDTWKARPDELFAVSPDWIAALAQDIFNRDDAYWTPELREPERVVPHKRVRLQILPDIGKNNGG